MPRVSEQYKEHRREEVLAAARRCFVRNGFHRTSMQDVFAEAGKSAGAVYRYFPSKDDLIVAVAEENLRDVTAVLRGAVSRSEGRRGVGDILAELWAAVAERQQERQLATTALMVWSEALRDPRLAARLGSSVDEMSTDLTGFVRDRQRAGAWPGAAAPAIARAILMSLPGFLFTLALRGSDGVADIPDALRALWPDSEG